jgi:hypothetical protein
MLYKVMDLVHVNEAVEILILVSISFYFNIYIYIFIFFKQKRKIIIINIYVIFSSLKVGSQMNPPNGFYEYNIVDSAATFFIILVLQVIEQMACVA